MGFSHRDANVWHLWIKLFNKDNVFVLHIIHGHAEDAFFAEDVNAYVTRNDSTCLNTRG